MDNKIITILISMINSLSQAFDKTTYHEMKTYRMESNTNESYSVSHDIQCIRKCISNPNCKSANLISTNSNEICELNKISLFWSSNLRKDESSVFLCKLFVIECFCLNTYTLCIKNFHHLEVKTSRNRYFKKVRYTSYQSGFDVNCPYKYCFKSLKFKYHNQSTHLRLLLFLIVFNRVACYESSQHKAIIQQAK